MTVQNRRRARRAFPATLVLAAVASAGILALGASAATTEIAVGQLAIVSGQATGQVSGFKPNAQVTIEGNEYTSDSRGVVTLNAAPVGGDSALTIQFVDAAGSSQTVIVPLTDQTSGLPLTPDQLADALPNLTRDSRVTVGDSSTSGGSGGSGGTGGSGGSTPAGATQVRGGTSISAGAVASPARLVVDRVSFQPGTVRSRQPIRAQVRIKDTRGFLVRDALVYIAGVPERRILAVAEARTNAEGIATFTLRPTRLLPLKRGARLTMFVRARKAGDNLLAGVSSRRLVSLQLSAPKR